MIPAELLATLMTRTVDLACRRRWWVFVFYALACALLLPAAADRLGINSDTAEMISQRLAWRRIFNDYRAQFPVVTDSLVIVVRGDSETRVDESARRLADALRGDRLFAKVDRPGSGPFFDTHGLLFLSTPELEAVVDRAAEIQPALAALAGDRDLVDFFSLLARGAEAGMAVDADLAQPVARGLEEALGGGTRRVEWAPEGAEAPFRSLVISEPVQDFASLAPGRAAMERVEALVEQLQLVGPGLQVAMTGPVALQTEELASVAAGATQAGILALAMVAVVLLLCLRSIALVAACLVTLVVGLALTGAFAAFAVGHLNLISVAFAVLYIGLGIDFAIHLALRYREALAWTRDRRVAAIDASRDVGTSLALCAVTTSIGFFAFFPTEFAGVSELGLISGTGMFISLLVTLTLLPALLVSVPVAPGTPGEASPPLAAMGRWIRRRSGLIRLAAVLALVASTAATSLVTFDSNPINLRDPDSPSVRAYRDLLTDPRRTPMRLALLAPPEQVWRLAPKLAALPETESVVTLRDFVPDAQHEKLAIIDELALILGGVVPTQDATLPPAQAVAASLTELADRLAGETPQAARLTEAARRAAATLRAEGPAADRLVERLDEVLLAGLRHRTGRLVDGLSAGPVALEDLPASLVERWVAPDGRWRLEIIAAPALARAQADAEFVAAVSAVAPNATGLPLVHVKAGEAVVGAFQQAFITAGVLVTLVLLVLLRRPRSAFLALVPLVLATPLTAAGAALLQIPFNFANVITLPLLLGVGVDNGIHMVHRAMHAPPRDGNLLATSTARAVFFSALTTVVSFGNLAFSPHTGTASMGVMLTLGMICYLLCTLIVLPAFLERYGKTPA